MTFDLKSVEDTCVTLPKDHCVQVPGKYIKVCGYSDPCCKNLNQWSLTPRWPLTPHLLRTHVRLYPRIIVSKSHGNTSIVCGYSDQFCKIPPTSYILHKHGTYYIQNEWSHSLFLNKVQARQQRIIFYFKITFWMDKVVRLIGQTCLNSWLTPLHPSIYISLHCIKQEDYYIAKLLFHQSPTRHSDYHSDDVVTVI